MSGSVTLARRRPPLAPQAGADEMMLGEKALQIFMGRTDVSHGLTSKRSKCSSRSNRSSRIPSMH
jgi:hypothetical protein